MVTRNNLIYSIAAAQRIIGITKRIFEVREWAWVILVRGPKFCRFMSKKAFKKHFADRRREEAKKVNLIRNPQNQNNFRAASSSVKGFYELQVNDQAINCNCEDYKNQIRFIRKGICKHGYAVLNLLGFESLSQYIERDRSYEKVDRFDPFKDAPVSLSNGARKSDEPRRKGRSVD